MTTRVAVLASSPLVQAGLDALLAESPGVVLVTLPFDPGGTDARSELTGSDLSRSELSRSELSRSELSRSELSRSELSPLERAAGSGAHVLVWAPASSLDVATTLGAGLVDLRSGVYGDAPASAPALVVIADLSPRDAAGAVRAGARAVLPNGVRAEALAAAVAAVAAGLVVFPADDAAGVLGVDEVPNGLDGGAAPAVGPLSARERDVLGLVAEGLANKQIAYRLGISEHTVKTHIASLFTKLHAGTRAEAVVTAARSGLLLL